MPSENQKGSTTDTLQANQQLREEQFRKFIEMEVLKVIKNLSEQEGNSPELLQEIAQHTLDVIKPGMTLEELYKAALKLDDKYGQLGPVVIKVMQEYEEKYEMKAVDYVTELIKNKKYEEANTMVQKILEFKMVQ